MVNTKINNISPGRPFSGVLSTIVLTFDSRPGIISKRNNKMNKAKKAVRKTDIEAESKNNQKIWKEYLEKNPHRKNKVSK